MNPAHLHLVLTHVPIFGCLIGLGLFVLSLFRGDRELQRISVWLFLLTGLLAVPTYLTGRPASALLSRMMPGTSMDLGDQHAEVAMIALALTSVLGVAALLCLFISRRDKPLPGWFSAGFVFLATLAAVSMIWTASLGGQIRHSEIRNNSEMKAGP